MILVDRRRAAPSHVDSVRANGYRERERTEMYPPKLVIRIRTYGPKRAAKELELNE